MEKLIVTVDKLKVGRTVLPRGSEFEASHKVAKLLKDIGKAKDATEKRTVDLPVRVKKEEPEAVEEAVPLAPTYERRDMQATGQTGAAKPPSSSPPGRQPRKYRSRG